MALPATSAPCRPRSRTRARRPSRATLPPGTASLPALSPGDPARFALPAQGLRGTGASAVISLLSSHAVPQRRIRQKPAWEERGVGMLWFRESKVPRRAPGGQGEAQGPWPFRDLEGTLGLKGTWTFGVQVTFSSGRRFLLQQSCNATPGLRPGPLLPLPMAAPSCQLLALIRDQRLESFRTHCFFQSVPR